VGRIRGSAKSFEREAAAEIADLGMYPSSREISRELWACSKKYFLRFFRLTDAGLVELGLDGQLLPANSPATGISRHRRVPHPVQVTVPQAETGHAVAPGNIRPLPGISRRRSSRPGPSHGDFLHPRPRGDLIFTIPPSENDLPGRCDQGK
jgi:hypothetical protein